MKLEQFYQVFSMHPTGIGSSDPLDWREACDELAECMVKGRDATVYLMDPPEGRSCGMMIDVTDRAEAQVREWNKNRHTGATEAISDPTDDRFDEWKELRAMEAAE